MTVVCFRVHVSDLLLGRRLSGERSDRVGCGFLTAKVCAHTPPPGPGLTTEIEGNEAEATSPAGMAVVSCVALTKVVARLEPFTCTTDPGMKLLPLRVNVKAPLPAIKPSRGKPEKVGWGVL